MSQKQNPQPWRTLDWEELGPTQGIFSTAKDQASMSSGLSPLLQMDQEWLWTYHSFLSKSLCLLWGILSLIPS